MNPAKIGILGLGTVGSGTINVLARNRERSHAVPDARSSHASLGARFKKTARLPHGRHRAGERPVRDRA